jgi:hypothetical protein
MPVARYFLYVGGVLLALLFVVDALAPQPVVVAGNAAPSIDKSTVRITSDRKWPERVVYDTSLPTIVPPAATTRVAAAAPPPAAEVTARARDSFAQFVPAEARKSEPQAPRKRKIAKGPSAPSSPPLRVAQQSHYGFIGAPTWNSTW